MVIFARWTEQLGEDRSQGVGPDLVARVCGMQLVARVHDAVKQPAFAVGEPVVDIHIANRLSVGECREISIDGVDGRHDRQVVATGEDRGQDDDGCASAIHLCAGRCSL